jgi:hypothetical protein
MRKERKEIGLGFILLNEGQLPWLPKNPRTWTQTDIDKTAASIKEDPDFLEDRPLLVVPFSARDYIVFAGNLRHEGSFAAKRSKVPCVVYYPETEADYETIKRRAMKDNGSFGKFDWDEVFSGPWGTMDLEAMGIGRAFEDGAKGAGSPDDYGTEFNLPDGEKSNFCTMSFQVSAEQRDTIEAVLKAIKEKKDFKVMETYGNNNSNGNALAFLAEYGKM